MQTLSLKYNNGEIFYKLLINWMKHHRWTQALLIIIIKLRLSSNVALKALVIDNNFKDSGFATNWLGNEQNKNSIW